MASDNMFAPPTNYAMRVLDRGFFKRTVPLCAARIFRARDIADCRAQLLRTKELLKYGVVRPIVSDPDEQLARAGGKCLILRPGVEHSDRSTWSTSLRSLESAGTVGVIPFALHLTYASWSYSDIMHAVLPADDADELPTSFAQAGHVAHLNLRDKHLAHKHLVAQVLLDKNPALRTVINKVASVGSVSAFRTFPYEVLCGPDDLDVTVREQKCTFRFNFGQVYWNTRLQTEHERIVAKFGPGEAVCDVMAGIGPFAVPAGKKRVFVWANDLNPASYRCLCAAIGENKVQHFVQAFHEDGLTFIPNATAQLAEQTRQASLPKRAPMVQPATFAHYVMNLPSHALSFLPAFVGLLAKPTMRKLFQPHTTRPLPMIHAYCFVTKSDDKVAQSHAICDDISKQLDHPITPDTADMEIHDVRDTAPKKSMFCASFRLPPEVAFREVPGTEESKSVA